MLFVSMDRTESVAVIIAHDDEERQNGARTSVSASSAGGSWQQVGNFRASSQAYVLPVESEKITERCSTPLRNSARYHDEEDNDGNERDSRVPFLFSRVLGGRFLQNPRLAGARKIRQVITPG